MAMPGCPSRDLRPDLLWHDLLDGFPLLGLSSLQAVVSPPQPQTPPESRFPPTSVAQSAARISSTLSGTPKPLSFHHFDSDIRVGFGIAAIMRGRLHRRAIGLIMEWATAHQRELLEKLETPAQQETAEED